jgi:hypothetical protein
VVLCPEQSRHDNNIMAPSKSKAAVWFLLSLSVAAVRSDAFSSSIHTTAVLPRSRSVIATTHSNSYILRRSSKDDGPNGESERNESSASKSSSSADHVPRGGADVTKPPPPLPTLAAYRKFALPCLALWVASPLLSLVDTSFVGLSVDASTSAAQLAALGPATTFFDGSTYLFAFLNVATTNLYSSARAQKGEQSDKAESVVRTAARVGLKCGVGIMLFLFAFSRPLLKLYIGAFLEKFKK